MKKSNKEKSLFFGYKSMMKNEFSGYSKTKLIKDILAGLTVAAVALPLALAFGASSVDPEHAALGISAGLITAIIAGLVTGILGGGSFQISGPTGAMTVILTGIVGGTYGIQGMFLACFIAGIILLVAGLIKLGKLLNYIPKPVITGFTSGIAIVIALGQLGNFFGVKVVGETTLDKLIYFFTDSLRTMRVENLKTIGCSLAVVLLMVFFPKKWAKIVPASLIAIILITLITALLPNFFTINKIGKIPASLINTQTLSFSGFSFNMLKELLPSAITIALLGMIESLMCGVSASNMKKESFDSNIELIAQGLGNMVVPFFGGVPSTAAIARTSVAIKSGGQTRLTSVFQSIFLIICMFLLAPVIGFIPYAALAGVLMVTAFKMNDWTDIKHYFSTKSISSIILFLVTMISTVVLDLTYAILIGIATSLIILLIQLSTAHTESNKDDEASVTTSVKGLIFFANARDFIAKLKLAKTEEIKNFAVDLSGVTYIDESALEIMSEYFIDLKKEMNVSIVGLTEKIQKTLTKSGFVEKVGIDSFPGLAE